MGKDNCFRINRFSGGYKQPEGLLATTFKRSKEDDQTDPDKAVTEQSRKDKSPHPKKKGKQIVMPVARQSIPVKKGTVERSMQNGTSDSVQFSVSSKYKNSDKKDVSEASHTPSQNSRFRLNTPILISRPQSQITGREGGSCGSESDCRAPTTMPLTGIVNGNIRGKAASSSKSTKMRIRSSHQPGRSTKIDSFEPLRSKKHPRIDLNKGNEIKSFTIGEFYKPKVKTGQSRNKEDRSDSQSNQLLEDQKNLILDKLGSPPLNNTYTGAAFDMRPIRDRSTRGSKRLSECLSNCISEQASPVLPSPLQLQRPQSLQLLSMPKFSNLVRGHVVGEGSYGVVYTALDKTNGKVYAVKEMKTQSDDPYFRFSKSFENEIDVLSKVDHQNVLKYYGYSKEEGKMRIITDYMEEGSLKNIVEEMGPLPVSLIKRYTLQIVQGLKYLHSKGTVDSCRHCPQRSQVRKYTS